MKNPAEPDPDFVSDQVSQARRYYLNLNPSGSSSLTVVCGGVETTRSDYLISRERFAYFGIEMVTEGRGELTLGKHLFSLSPGMMFAYGPATPHRIVNQPGERMRKFYVDIAGSEAESALRTTGLLDGRPLRVTRMHELVEIFETLDHEARGDSEIASEVCEQLMRLMFVKIRQCCLVESSATPRAYATYERVREHIVQHFLRLHTVEAVAAECDITPIHLSR